MLLTRLPHPQCLSPAWTARRLLAARQRCYSTGDVPTTSSLVRRSVVVRKENYSRREERQQAKDGENPRVTAKRWRAALVPDSEPGSLVRRTLIKEDGWYDRDKGGRQRAKSLVRKERARQWNGMPEGGEGLNTATLREAEEPPRPLGVRERSKRRHLKAGAPKAAVIEADEHWAARLGSDHFDQSEKLEEALEETEPQISKQPLHTQEAEITTHGSEKQEGIPNDTEPQVSKPPNVQETERTKVAIVEADEHWAARLGSDHSDQSERQGGALEGGEPQISKPPNTQEAERTTDRSAEIEIKLPELIKPSVAEAASPPAPQTEVPNTQETERTTDRSGEIETKLPEIKPSVAEPTSPPAPQIEIPCSNSPGLEITNDTTLTEHLQTNNKPNTILEELFPEYKEELLNSSASTDDTAHLPRLDPTALQQQQGTAWQPMAPPTKEQPFLHPDHEQPATSTTDPHTLRQRLAATVLVISCASRTLSLSDFIRLSPRGEHIEGWTSGIIRVIPGRDPATLARQSHYFVLFSTAAAAEAYRDNIRRLHTLSKKYTPTHPTSRAAPAPGVLVGGEDVGALVNAFTLLPNSQKHLFGSTLRRPYRPAVARMVETGGYHPLITAGADRRGGNLVLVSLDAGRMNAYELGVAIGLDGKQRNLQWRLEGGAEDVVLLGSKSDPRTLQEEGEERGALKGVRGPPRFIVKFRDGVEAGRFVRAWHSRVLEGEVLERLAKAGEEQRARVSAEILW